MQVLDLFRRFKGKAFNPKQVAARLNIVNHDVRRELSHLLDDLATAGELESLGRGRFMAAVQRQERVEGTIQITRYGRGFVMQDNGEELSLTKGNTGSALWGDRVEVEWVRRGSRSIPRVARVVQRLRPYIVVTIEQVRDYAFGHPSDQRIHTDFFIPARHLRGAVTGEKVLVEMLDWDSPDDLPTAEVVEILGKAGVHEVEMHAILAEFGLPYTFPPGVEGAAAEISREITPQELAGRRDFREVLTLTIDPEDAKDFDDALSLRALPVGGWEVGVHIADVTHYLQPGSVID
ncbi:MAG: ribonuclease, partial [Bacteroidota bacterium]